MSKITVFYVIEVKDEMRGYNLKKVRRDEDEKIRGDDGGAGIKWCSINGKQEAVSSRNGDMSFVLWHSLLYYG